MGIIDAFSAEDRVEITVRELIETIDARANAECKFYIAMDMLRQGIRPETVLAVFGYEPEKINISEVEK